MLKLITRAEKWIEEVAPLMPLDDRQRYVVRKFALYVDSQEKTINNPNPEILETEEV